MDQQQEILELCQIEIIFGKPLLYSIQCLKLIFKLTDFQSFKRQNY